VNFASALQKYRPRPVPSPIRSLFLTLALLTVLGASAQFYNGSQQQFG
jgi:hypothetical protein